MSVYELRKVAKRLGTDHDLALALWQTGNHEACSWRLHRRSVAGSP